MEHHSELHQLIERLRELGPDLLLAWAGWLVHSFVHSAGHSIRHGCKLFVRVLKSRAQRRV